MIVTDSQPASSRAVNDLQSTADSQQRQNVRCNVRINVFSSGRKTYSCFQQVQLRKKYITETTKLMNGWTNNSPLKDIAFTAIHVMPSLLLQKPSKTSKAKDHLKALERRINLWMNGNIDELLLEGKTIQSRFHDINTPKSITEMSKKFPLLMEKRKCERCVEIIIDK